MVPLQSNSYAALKTQPHSPVHPEAVGGFLLPPLGTVKVLHSYSDLTLSRCVVQGTGEEHGLWIQNFQAHIRPLLLLTVCDHVR